MERYKLRSYPSVRTAGSAVYLCEDKVTEKELAVKVISKRSQTFERRVRRLLHGVQIVSRTGLHPNLIAIRGVYELDGDVYIFMDYAKGGTLLNHIKRCGPLEERTAVHVVRQLLEALAHLHDRGVMHRDVKAENILLCEPAEGKKFLGRVCICDYGFATCSSPTNECVGSPGYCAPEIALIGVTQGKEADEKGYRYDEKCDIWSLGVTTYAMLSGLLPFTGSTPTEAHGTGGAGASLVGRVKKITRLLCCLYERTLIEKYIAEHGRCPVTGEALQKDDLVAVRQAPVAPFTSVNDETVPGLLSKFHAQWDAIMLEQFALRQQLTQTQQELAQALHQYEAACRVIATFLGDGRTSEGGHTPQEAELCAVGGNNANHGMDQECKNVLPDEVIQELNEHNSLQRLKRKSRAVPEALAADQCVLNFRELECVHVGKKICSASRLVGESVFVGLDDATIVRCNVPRGKVHTVGTGHDAAVRHIISLSGGDRGGNAVDHDLRMVSGSDDASLRFWVLENDVLVCRGVVRQHSGGVVGLRQLTFGSLVLSASSTEVGLADMSRLERVACVTGSSVGLPPITCLGVHPYGTVAAVGMEGKGFCVWSTTEMCVDTIVPLRSNGDIRSISFNADCFTLATGLHDGKAFVWDLRNLSVPLHELSSRATAPESPGQCNVASVVTFDDYGKYLAVGGKHVRVYDWASLSENQQELCTLESCSPSVVGLVWGGDAQNLISCSTDGVVRKYGPE